MSSDPDPLTSDAPDATLERLRPLVDWLVTYDQMHRVELAEVTARAEQAEPRAVQAEQRAQDAQRQALEAQQRAEEAQGHAEDAQRRAEDAQHKVEEFQQNVDEARREAERRVESAAAAAAEVARRDADEWQREAAGLRAALTEFEASSRSRELQLLEAMRNYLVDVGEAQDRLLQLARGAIGPDGRSDLQAEGMSVTSPPEAAATDDAPLPPQAGGAEDPPSDSAGTAETPPERTETAPPVPSVVAGQGHPTSRQPEHQDLTTDEHRLLDLHNMLDMQRLEVQLARRSWIGRRLDRRRSRQPATAPRLQGA